VRWNLPCVVLVIVSCKNGSNAPAMPAAPDGSTAASASAQPPASQSAAAPQPALPPRDPPDAYAAPALADADRIGIAGWRMHVGDARRVSEDTFDDKGWTPVDMPGFLPVATVAKQTTIWLRANFDLPANADPSKLALDLGARTGNTTVWLNGEEVGKSSMRNAPVFLPAPVRLRKGANTIAIKLVVGSHVGGVRWSGDAAVGRATTRHTGMVTRGYEGKSLGVYIPRSTNIRKFSPLVVALPGWDGNIYGFTHSSLMVEAERRGWIVLVPDTFGNVLYTGEAETKVLRAIDLMNSELNIDRERIYLTGVSMGGAGALQIGYRYPDRFAAIAAFYGDSRYEPRGYVKGILRDQQTADRYSVLLFHENARNTPVLLVHARDDKVSAFVQSEQLARADAKSGLQNHRLIAPPTGGHSLQVVEDAVPEMVALFEKSRREPSASRVTFTTTNDRSQAWWLTVTTRRAVTKRGDSQFGTVDVSLNGKNNTIRIHAIDDGVWRASANLGDKGFNADNPITLVVETATKARLDLDGLKGWTGLTNQGGGTYQLDQEVESRGKGRTLPPLPAGTYTLIP
jgi:poly(3-hydroxybutyrate) depolymerase